MTRAIASRSATASRTLVALAVAISVSGNVGSALGQGRPPGPSQQDKETARSLFDKGVEAEKAGQLEAALAFFRDANQLVHVPSTALFFARVLAKKGLLIEARAAALEAAQAPVQPNEVAFQGQCRAEASVLAQALEGRIPSVVLRIEGPALGEVALSIDQQTLPMLASNPARKLNPGTHALHVTAPGFLPVSPTFTLSERESKEVRVVMQRAAGGAVPALGVPAGSRDPSESVGPPLLMGLGFGLGGASLIAFAITGGLSFARTKDLEDACGGQACPPGREDDWQEAKTLATAADATLIVGGVLAAAGFGGLIWWATERDDQVGLEIELGPRSASISVRF